MLHHISIFYVILEGNIIIQIVMSFIFMCQSYIFKCKMSHNVIIIHRYFNFHVM